MHKNQQNILQKYESIMPKSFKVLIYSIISDNGSRDLKSKGAYLIQHCVKWFKGPVVLH